MNNKKKLVTLKDYIDSGITEKMVLGFSLYDADLENYEGKPLDLTSNFDKFHDCEVVSIIASPNPISPTRFAELIISISTTNFRVTNNLNEDDFRNMIISNGDYYTKKMNNSISLSFNNNKIVGEIMNYLFDGGVKSETIKLILFDDNNEGSVFSFVKIGVLIGVFILSILFIVSLFEEGTFIKILLCEFVLLTPPLTFFIFFVIFKEYIFSI